MKSLQGVCNVGTVIGWLFLCHHDMEPVIRRAAGLWRREDMVRNDAAVFGRLHRFKSLLAPQNAHCSAYHTQHYT